MVIQQYSLSFFRNNLDEAYKLRSKFLMKVCKPKATKWMTNVCLSVVCTFQAEMTAAKFLKLAIKDSPSLTEIIICVSCSIEQEKTFPLLVLDRKMLHGDAKKLKQAILLALPANPKCSACQKMTLSCAQLGPHIFIEVNTINQHFMHTLSVLLIKILQRSFQIGNEIVEANENLPTDYEQVPIFAAEEFPVEMDIYLDGKTY